MAGTVSQLSAENITFSEDKHTHLDEPMQDLIRQIQVAKTVLNRRQTLLLSHASAAAAVVDAQAAVNRIASQPPSTRDVASMATKMTTYDKAVIEADTAAAALKTMTTRLIPEIARVKAELGVAMRLILLDFTNIQVPNALLYTVYNPRVKLNTS